jgi:hypothetical protein
VFVDAGGDVFGVGSLHHDRHAARGLNIFDGALHLALAFGKGLAALIGDGAGDVFDVGFKQDLEFEEGLNPVANWRAAPPDESTREEPGPAPVWTPD